MVVQGGLSSVTGVNLKPQQKCVKAAEKNPIIRCKSSTEYRGYCLLVVAIYIILPVVLFLTTVFSSNYWKIKLFMLRSIECHNDV